MHIYLSYNVLGKILKDVSAALCEIKVFPSSLGILSIVPYRWLPPRKYAPPAPPSPHLLPSTFYRWELTNKIKHFSLIVCPCRYCYPPYPSPIAAPILLSSPCHFKPFLKHCLAFLLSTYFFMFADFLCYLLRASRRGPADGAT
jgi:hypothetical protein